MSGISELIHNADLTKTQKMIGSFILDNVSDGCFMTSTEIAVKIGVSESSVIRFSRALGFEGFMGFQRALRKNYQEQVSALDSAITVPAQRIAKLAKLETGKDYLRRHFKNAAKNLEAVFSRNQAKAFDEAADLIVSAKHKYIVASRGNACLGDYFLLYMKHMLPGVETTASSSISPIDDMCSITSDDILIIFSFPRYSTMDKLAAKMAADAKAPVILITDKPSADLASYATALLSVPVDSSTFFNSMVGPQFVMEVLLDVISHKVKGIEKRLRNIDRYIGELGTY
ncbi:MAG: MurR/RpiR family transcriptional regulator [Lachnospiraceae bacterium]|jgi:DNA-binding MurR/RpiR family transcriptional regulator|nr:MurR/RpiR family transcriptional regulator [Lachnospiraceae bacterium]